MIGAYDFCGHYEWTFQWLHDQRGEDFVLQFWEEAIGGDSQSHAARLIREKGFTGMAEYWAHTLAEEAAGYVATQGEGVFRLDIHDCPSKGFLLHNKLVQSHDYCDHCIGWIGPVMKAAGFEIDHQHNHCGQCWWEFHRPGTPSDNSTWPYINTTTDTFHHATGPKDKQPPSHD